MSLVEPVAVEDDIEEQTVILQAAAAMFAKAEAAALCELWAKFAAGARADAARAERARLPVYKLTLLFPKEPAPRPPRTPLAPDVIQALIDAGAAKRAARAEEAWFYDFWVGHGLHRVGCTLFAYTAKNLRFMFKRAARGR